jgi:Protein of unknown function (DUF3618)
MGQSTEELNDDIEATRQRLSRDVDELGTKVSPSQIAHRRKEAAKNKLGSLRDRVMGSAQDATGSVASAGQSMTGSVSDTASGAVQGLQQRAEGNPLAAGVIAFGAGMLLSSLFPATRAETQVAQKGMDTAREHGQPLIEEAKSMGQEVGQNLKEAGSQAASEVASTAKDSAQHVKEEGQESAQNVRG